MDNCIGCGIEKTKSNTDKSSTRKDGFRSGCKICFSLWSRLYEKTPSGYLMRSYRNMKSRVDGIQKRKFNLYDGLYLMPKEEFKAYVEDENFLKLLSEYKDSNWELGKAPSVDRIYPWFGYHKDNIRWVSHSENSAHILERQRINLKDNLEL